MIHLVLIALQLFCWNFIFYYMWCPFLKSSFHQFCYLSLGVCKAIHGVLIVKKKLEDRNLLFEVQGNPWVRSYDTITWLCREKRAAVSRICLKCLFIWHVALSAFCDFSDRFMTIVVKFLSWVMFGVRICSKFDK